MTTYTVHATSQTPDGRTTVGPYQDRSEAERAMTAIAVAGFEIHGSRRVFEKVWIEEQAGARPQG